LGENTPDLIDPKTFSSNFVRFLIKRSMISIFKKTCDLYEKIKLGYEARMFGG